MTYEECQEVIKSEVIRIVNLNGGEMVYRDLEAELLKSPAVALALELVRLEDCDRKVDARPKN